jgi:hypothetical protein
MRMSEYIVVRRKLQEAEEKRVSFIIRTTSKNHYGSQIRKDKMGGATRS